MSPKAVLLGLLFAAACQSSDLNLSGAYPEDTGWLAAVFLDDSGRFVAATRVLPFVDEPLTVRIPEVEATEVLVYAWREGQLEPLVARADEALGRPIRFGRPGETLLPEPSWVARGRPLGANLRPVNDPPGPLAADWLPDCPLRVEPEQEALVDIRCSARACPRRFEQEGCRILLPLAQCGFGAFEARVGGTGDVEIQNDLGPPGCRKLPVSEPAIASVDCGGCQIDLYVRDRGGVTPLPVDRVVLAPEVEVERSSPPYPGRLKAMAVLADRVIAAVTRSQDCPQDGLTLRIIDAASLAERTPVEHSGCGLTHLTKDPSGGAMLLTQTSSGSRLVRLDGEGQAVFARFLPGSDREPRALAVSETGDRVAAVFRRTEGRGGFLELWNRDLEVVVNTVELDDAPGGLAFGRLGRLFVAGDGILEIFDPDDGGPEGGLLAGTGEGIANDFNALVPFPNESMVGIASNRRSGIHVIRGTVTISAGLFFGRSSVLTDALPRPTSRAPRFPGLAAGFGPLDAPSPAAFLARFSDVDAKFLPTETSIGRGPVLDLGLDGAGRLWARLPAEGAVVRIQLGDF